MLGIRRSSPRGARNPVGEVGEGSEPADRPSAESVVGGASPRESRAGGGGGTGAISRRGGASGRRLADGGEEGDPGGRFGVYGTSIDEWSSIGDLAGKKVVESELTTLGIATLVELKPMSSLCTSVISEAAPLKKRAKHQDGGDDENEAITKDSERSVRRRENAHEEYGNNIFDEEPEKIRDTQERAHLEKDMKETLMSWSPYRSSTMENQNMGSLSEQLDIGSQAMEKNDTSDLRAVGKEIADEVDSCEECSSPEYNPSSEVEYDHTWVAPDSPSTKQQIIENTRKLHMAAASRALDYYHTKHPGDDYTPIHVNLKHVIYFIDTRGYYIHMNFTARNMEDETEKIFFAELYRSFEGPDERVVTACDIVGPESLGGLRHVWHPNRMSFVGDTMDVQNCYACDDFIKHIDGAMYEAGHMGHNAYEVTDISEE